MPKITIITPTYNRASLLKRMIRSVQEQHFTDWELIVFDDGSTDDTKALVTGLKDARIKYFFAENSGAGDKRNRGVEKAVGKFITFLDSDDEVKPQWLERLNEAISEEAGGVVSCGWEKIDEAGKLLEIGLPKNLGAMYNNFVMNFLSGTFLLPKEFFKEAGGYDTELTAGQHTEFFIRLIPVLIRHQVKVKNIYEPLVRIHLHKGDRIRHNYNGIYLGSTMTLKKHRSLFIKHPQSYYNRLSVAGVCAMRTKRYKEGKELFREAFKIKPYDIRSYTRLIIGNIPVLRRAIWKG